MLTSFVACRKVSVSDKYKGQMRWFHKQKSYKTLEELLLKVERVVRLGDLIKCDESNRAEAKIAALLLYHCVEPYRLHLPAKRDMTDSGFDKYIKRIGKIKEARDEFIESRLVELCQGLTSNLNLKKLLHQGNQHQYENAYVKFYNTEAVDKYEYPKYEDVLTAIETLNLAKFNNWPQLSD